VTSAREPCSRTGVGVSTQTMIGEAATRRQ
jgi:hypothetical protein